MRVIASSTPLEWPCAVSTTTTSHSASINASARFQPSSPTPVAAATRKRPRSSLQALGNFCAFSMSFTAISVVHHQNLLDAMLVQQPLRLLGANAFAHRDELVFRHQLGNFLAHIGG